MKNLLLFVTLCVLSSCGNQSKQNNTTQTEETDNIPPIQKSTIIEPRLEEDFESIPEIFNDLNNPRVFITYNQLVNGYNINVMWFPWRGNGEVGHAILEFTHTSGTRFYIHNSYYSDDYFYSQTEREFKNGEVYSLDYSPPSKDEQLGHNTPFQFFDADFDGELELCINNWRCGHRDYNTYDVYKIRSYHAEKLTRKPYDFLEDGNEFDFKNKTITQIWSDGWDHSTRLVYGYHEMPKNQTDEKALFDDFYYPIKLDSLFMLRSNKTFVYARQRDSLILVDTYLF